jgi:hypothetical protein
LEWESIFARGLIIANLAAKDTQRNSVQGTVNRASDVLMKDKDVKTAVDTLHSSLSKSGDLVEGMGNREKFREIFLRKVAHAAVKTQVRQTTGGAKLIKVNFTNFLFHNSEAKKLVFKGILRPNSSQDLEGDVTPDSLLGAAFNAIGKATTHSVTPDSIKQTIGAVKVDDLLCVANSFEDSFEVEWENSRLDKILLLSSGKVISSEDAFSLIRGKVVAIIPTTLDSVIPTLDASASNVPKSLTVARSDVRSRFTATLQGTALAGLFSVAEEATEGEANDALRLIGGAFHFLKDIAKPRWKKFFFLDYRET